MGYFPVRAIPFGLRVLFYCFFLLFYYIIYNIHLPRGPIKLIDQLYLSCSNDAPQYKFDREFEPLPCNEVKDCSDRSKFNLHM